ncbi:MAG: hypothetical protein ACMUEL_01725 [Flavobacteriales bacterium Tduv]
MIVYANITMSPFASKEDPTYVVGGSKGRGEKANQSKKRKGKKKRLNQE